jgi:hypothetical protein
MKGENKESAYLVLVYKPAKIAITLNIIIIKRNVFSRAYYQVKKRN